MEAARARARRRLIGALVLLVIGVVGFPILFETQPRPLPVDTPIVVPSTVTSRRESNTAAAPSRPPAVRPAEVQAPVEPPAEAAVAATGPVPPPVRTAASAQPAVARSGSSADTAGTGSAGERVALPTSAASAAAPSAGVVATSAVSASAAASDSASGRFVVQVGAYTDAATLRDTRAKVEKIGFKTYTQVINSDAGPRTRVRLGPFATRDEADAAAAKLKRAGLPGNILAL